MADDAWYYSDGGQRKGPIGLDAVRALTDAGVVHAETLVWGEGMADWEPAFRHIPGLVPPAPTARLATRTSPARADDRDYHETVGMGEAVSRFFGNYLNFGGRSNRGEFWWWTLFNIIVALLALLVDVSILGSAVGDLRVIGSLWSVVTFVPSLALLVRRLHDTDRTGWWVAPLIGSAAVTGAVLPQDGDLVAVPATVVAFGLATLAFMIVMLVWNCQRGTSGPNRFG